MLNSSERTINPVAANAASVGVASVDVAEVRVNESSAGVRLTRRGRFLFFGLPTVALIVGMFLMLSALLQPAQATTGEPVTAQGDRLVEVTVAHGDTLWAIAEHYAPERDVRDTVALIHKHNSFDEALVPGQKLVVPVSY
ncbi:LysM peptidoglycan-binding domain-containing protein [Pseudoglutamicibacter cumminsii]|uniref:LysM peptidoglycan-binding domain-containing protein n=1 Tax=Pseudoglutamicibacter cumminsii TaxID=156979 RepID=A0AAP4C7C5_9MICC|nr:LysM peptidoglycan-binding domain-containing protein [Pseudoglutamicibacter cumminsii]MDK6275628.1 LysM peptidoglycan-binding domain-containing protein [Pseudoglutamicibacter cumminsii]